MSSEEIVDVIAVRFASEGGEILELPAAVADMVNTITVSWDADGTALLRLS